MGCQLLQVFNRGWFSIFSGHNASTTVSQLEGGMVNLCLPIRFHRFWGSYYWPLDVVSGSKLFVSWFHVRPGQTLFNVEGDKVDSFVFCEAAKVASEAIMGVPNEVGRSPSACLIFVSIFPRFHRPWMGHWLIYKSLSLAFYHSRTWLRSLHSFNQHESFYSSQSC